MNSKWNNYMVGVVILALAFGALFLQYVMADDEVKVEAKSGSVPKTDKIESRKLQNILPESRTIIEGEYVKTISKILVPPNNNTKFVPYIGPYWHKRAGVLNWWPTHVDVEFYSDDLPPDRLWDEPDKIQVQTVTPLDTAARARLRVEGNLRPPGSGGSLPHWSVKIEEIDIDADTDNDSTANPRIPSESEAEDLAEHPSLDTPDTLPGLVLGVNNDHDEFLPGNNPWGRDFSNNTADLDKEGTNYDNQSVGLAQIKVKIKTDRTGTLKVEVPAQYYDGYGCIKLFEGELPTPGNKGAAFLGDREITTPCDKTFIFYVEGLCVEIRTFDLTARFVPTEGQIVSTDVLSVTTMLVDIDIDSNNSGGIDGDSSNDEDKNEVKPGKMGMFVEVVDDPDDLSKAKPGVIRGFDSHCITTLIDDHNPEITLKKLPGSYGDIRVWKVREGLPPVLMLDTAEGDGSTTTDGEGHPLWGWVGSATDSDILITATSDGKVFLGLELTVNGAKVTMDVVKINDGLDLDVDSDNNNGANEPDRLPGEDKIEDDATKMGKLFVINDNDDDGDEVKDHADGFNCDGVAGNNDDQNAQEADFRPMVFEVTDIDPTQAKVKFTYSASTPAATPVAGKHLRIWTENGKVARNKASVKTGGDYVPNGTVMTLDKLGFAGGTAPVTKVTLYIEVVAEVSSGLPEGRVLVEVDVDGNGVFDFKDAIRVTATTTLDLAAKQYAPYASIGGNTYSEVKEADEGKDLSGWPLGPFTYYNNNDSNHDKTKDVDQNANAVTGEKDMRKLVLAVSPDLTTGTVTLTRQNNKVRIWSASTKGAAAKILFGTTNTKTWNLANRTNQGGFNSVMDSLYTEGASYGACNITATLKNAAGNVVKTDVLKVTVCPGEPLVVKEGGNAWDTMVLPMSGGQFHAQWFHFSGLDLATDYNILYKITAAGAPDPFADGIPANVETKTIKLADWKAKLYTAWDKGWCPYDDKNLGAFYILFPKVDDEGKAYWFIIQTLDETNKSPNYKSFKVVVDYPHKPEASPARNDLAKVNFYLSCSKDRDDVFLQEAQGPAKCSVCGRAAEAAAATLWRVVRADRKQNGAEGQYYTDIVHNLAFLKTAAEGTGKIFAKNEETFGEWKDIDKNNKFFVLIAKVYGCGGYFWGMHERAPWDNKTHYKRNKSNYADMVFIHDYTVYGANGEREMKATLAHELQHNIHGEADSREALWINEGCSTYAEAINSLNMSVIRFGKQMYSEEAAPNGPLRSSMLTLSRFGKPNVWHRFSLCAQCKSGEPDRMHGAHYEKVYLWTNYLAKNQKQCGSFQADKTLKSIVQDGLKQGFLGINGQLKSTRQVLRNPVGHNAMTETDSRPFIDWTVANYASGLAGNTNKRYKYSSGGLDNYKVTPDNGVVNNTYVSKKWYELAAVYMHYPHPDGNTKDLKITIRGIPVADKEKISVNAVRQKADGSFIDVVALDPVVNGAVLEYTCPKNANLAKATIVITNFGAGVGSDIHDSNIWDYGLATAPFNDTSISDTLKSWTDDKWKGNGVVTIYKGPGEGIRAVSGNTGDKITVTRAWDVVPTAESRYLVEKRDASDFGKVNSSTANTLKAADRNWTANHWKNVAYVTITEGPGKGQRRKIVGNNADTLTVAANWTTQPTAESKYKIEFQPAEGSFEIKAQEN
ncbi:MAG: hypothetical protein K8S55_13045 [Phycisphaerae bacterium]|nr:hypothetical protein [Phycisphaerae bacterium]